MVFPDPDGPITVVADPAGTVKDKPRSTLLSPNDLVMSRAVTRFVGNCSPCHVPFQSILQSVLSEGQDQQITQ